MWLKTLIRENAPGKSPPVIYIKTPFTRGKISARQAKFLEPCLNHFGTALPIYMTQNRRHSRAGHTVPILNRHPFSASVLFPGNDG